MKVFVYGTLKKGGYFSEVLTHSTFEGYATTVDKFTMWVQIKEGKGGNMTFPWLQNTDQGARVLGEIYEVDLPTLVMVDRIEGHPNFFNRELYDVIMEDGTNHQAYIYTLDQVGQELGELQDNCYIYKT